MHKIPDEVRELVIGLAAGTYQGVNHTHLTELLAEREGVHLSRASVRTILVGAGLNSPRRRRGPRHRVRRERYPQEGMLLQIDGSRHDWLQGRALYLTLIGAIDDATGTVPHAIFREQEDAHGYFLMLERIIKDKGIPLALSRIHRRTSLGTALEEASGCSSESGIMVPGNKEHPIDAATEQTRPYPHRL